MDKKISQLSGATTPLTGTEEIAIVQGGSTVKATVQDVADLAGGGTYLLYQALINQSGTSNPITTELNDTIGITVSFTRDSVGLYSANLGAVAAINLSKTVVLCSTPGFFSGGPYKYGVPVAWISTGGPDKYLTLNFYAVDSSGNQTGYDFGNSGLPIFIEIRVYP
jgi:hypothetical protein